MREPGVYNITLWWPYRRVKLKALAYWDGGRWYFHKHSTRDEGRLIPAGRIKRIGRKVDER